MASKNQSWEAIRVTAENVASLFGALPKSILNFVKSAAKKDWRDKCVKSGSSEPCEPKADPLMDATLIYESKDRRLCLFQDRDGHLYAVDSDKFA